MADGARDGDEGRAGCIRGGEMEEVKRDLEIIFERNMATHVSKQHKTSALCKNNLSNYEERLLGYTVYIV